MRLVSVQPLTASPGSALGKPAGKPEVASDSRRQKNWTLVIPFVDLAHGEPLAWIGTIRAKSLSEAWAQLRTMQADSRGFLELLLGDDKAAEGLHGPNYLEEYGVQLGDPLVLDPVEVGRCRVMVRYP